MHHVGRALAVVGVVALVVGVGMVTGAFGANPGITLPVGKSMVSCPGALSNGVRTADSEVIRCAAASTTTTTRPGPVTPTTSTTGMPTTTSTTTRPPSTATTVPSGGGNCGLATPAFCDNFTSETPPAVSRSGPLSAVWGVSRMNNVGWTGVTLGAEDDQPPTAGTPCFGVSPGKNFTDLSTSCAGGGLVETVNDGSGRRCSPGCNPGGT